MSPPNAASKPASSLPSTSFSAILEKVVKERRETVDFMMDVCRRFPGAEFWTNIFTPYPGSPIFQRAEELGFRSRSRSRDGLTISLGTPCCPGLTERSTADFRGCATICESLSIGHRLRRMGQEKSQRKYST